MASALSADQASTPARDFDAALTTLNTTISSGAALERAAAQRTQTCDHMREYVRRLGLDLSAMQFVHVTGTKGKGSTCAFVESILRRVGKRTGLYTSPHLLKITERYRINGAPLSEKQFARRGRQHQLSIPFSNPTSRRVWDKMKAAEAASSLSTFKDTTAVAAGTAAGVDSAGAHVPWPNFFRLVTLVGLWAFHREEVDVVVLEVGMGGRYDATNVVPAPVACGVCTLDLDHTQVLGDTLAKIAWEKGGIFKPGCNAFTVPQPAAPVEVLQQCATDAGIELTLVPLLPALDAAGRPYELGLKGSHQRLNAALAVALCRAYLWPTSGKTETTTADAAAAAAAAAAFATSDAMHEGLASCRWPGRCQVLGPQSTGQWRSRIGIDGGSSSIDGGGSGAEVTFFLDGAHTEQSVALCGDWFCAESAAAAAAPAPAGWRGVRRLLVFNSSHERDVVTLMSSLGCLTAHDEPTTAAVMAETAGGSSGAGVVATTGAAAAAGAPRAASVAQPCFHDALFMATEGRPSRHALPTARELLEKAGWAMPAGETEGGSGSAGSAGGTLVWQRTLEAVWLAAQDRDGMRRSRTTVVRDGAAAIAAALELAEVAPEPLHVLCTGSLYVVASILSALDWSG
ncbi:unnamed protein product [Phaeothamnion confervicola]